MGVVARPRVPSGASLTKTSSLANTASVRRALSVLKLIAMPIFFFLLPVYGLSYGEGDTTSNVTMVTILDDWYDLKGTQTEPPGFVKPLLYMILAASSLSDIIFVILNLSLIHI